MTKQVEAAQKGTDRLRSAVHAESYTLRDHLERQREAERKADPKVQENRLRRVADRQGLKLSKSRSRDPKAVDFGKYALIDVETGETVHPVLADRWTHCLSLAYVREYLGD